MGLGGTDQPPDLQSLIAKAARVLPAKLKRGKVKEIGEILASEFPVDHPITATGMTTLGVVVSMKESADGMLEVVMAQKPDINHLDKFGRSALHMACTSGNMEAVTTLLSHEDVKINA